VNLYRLLPSHFLRFTGSGQRSTPNDNATLILGFARIGEKFRFEMGNVVIQLLELVRKCVRLGLVARCMLVIKEGTRSGRPISGARRNLMTRHDRWGVGGNGRGVVAGRLGRWLRLRRWLPRLSCGERYRVMLSWIEKLPTLRFVAIVSRRVCGGSRRIRARCGLGRHLWLGGAPHRDWICIGVKQLGLVVFVHGHVCRGGLLSRGESEGSREFARVWLDLSYKHRRRRLPGRGLGPARR
jgi:hypothetical protein